MPRWAVVVGVVAMGPGPVRAEDEAEGQDATPSKDVVGAAEVPAEAALDSAASGSKATPGEAAAATVAPSLAPAQGDPGDLALLLERVDRLEAEVRKQARPALSPADFLPDLAFIADFGFAAFSQEDPRQTGAHDPTETGFFLQQVELSFGKAVDHWFRLDGNLVFSGSGVEIEEVYATTLALPARMQVRAGQFLTRFGRVNPTHPHQWAFVDQALVVGRLFGAEGSRGIGAEWSVLPPLPWSLELISSVTDAAGEGEARSFYGGNALGVKSPLDLQWTFVLEQFFALPASNDLLLGISFAAGPNGTGLGNRTEILGVDLSWKRRSLGLARRAQVSAQTEWAVRRMQRPLDAIWDLTGLVMAEVRPIPRLGFALRYEYGTPSRGLDGAVVADEIDPSWTTARHRGAGAFTIWPTEFSRIRVQGGIDAPLDRDQPIYSFMLAMELLVGSHAAHTW